MRETLRNFDSAFVLAGGKSNRMPFDKQRIKIDGRYIALFIADRLSAEFGDVFIISNNSALYDGSGYKIIPDEIEGCGPLGGLYTALCHSTGEYAYVTGCDMPYVDLDYIRYMKERLSQTVKPADGILTTTKGLAEPLNAFYHTRLKDFIPHVLASGKRRLAVLYEGKDMLYVPESILAGFDPEYRMFFNLNTQEDYDRFLSEMKGRECYMPQGGTDTKTLQRKAGIAARKGIPKEEAARLSRDICERLAESEAYKKANKILSYYPFGSEADVRYLNSRAIKDGKALALPICREEGIMVAAVPESYEELLTGKFGITAPDIKRSRVLEPAELDLVIVPCAAFEGSTRSRIGMGAGYYDRYLPRCVNAVCIAAAFEAQQVENLCVDDWDFVLDAIATEINWYVENHLVF